MGDLDRDDNGLIVVLQDADGNRMDKQGKATNQKGYLANPRTGDIIEGVSGKVMFPAADMDERGELPAPFCIERFNFNPHNLAGDLDYDVDVQTKQPVPQLL